MDIRVEYGNINAVVLATGTVLIIYLISLRFQKKRGLLFGNIEMLEKIAGGRLFGSRAVQLVLRVIVVMLIVLSFTDFTILIKKLRADGRTILVLDTSSSMLTPDFVPNRLEVAKISMIDIINEMPENAEMGVVTFSGKARLKIAPTRDKRSLVSTIGNITTEEPAGTSISDALVVASSLVNSSKDRIILITDGKNNAGLPLNESVRKVRETGAMVNVIGIGTLEGISRMIDELEGNFTLNTSELPVIDTNELEFIANQTNGTFVVLDSSRNFTDVLESMSFRREFQDIKVYKWMLALALLIILADWFLGLTKFSILGE